MATGMIKCDPSEIKMPFVVRQNTYGSLNNLTTTGLYYALGMDHGPGDSSELVWAHVLVIANIDNSNIRQFLIKTAIDSALYTRIYKSNDDAWSEWVRV